MYHTREIQIHTEFLSENMKILRDVKCSWEDNIKLDLKKRGQGCRMDSCGVGSCEHVNERSCSTRGGEILD